MQNDSSNSHGSAPRRGFLRDLAAASIGVGAIAPGHASAAATEGAGGRGILRIDNPSFIDTSLDSRSVSFENPTGERGAGGKTGGGRKGAAARTLRSGDRVILADLKGPGTIRHFWLTLSSAPPEVFRSLTLDIFYEGMAEPSVSVPLLDFFGLPHGRRAEFYSTLACCNQGYGLNSYFPMPFRQGVRVEAAYSGGGMPVSLYYQIDFTKERSLPTELGYLHASFRRENPTQLRRDFVIAEGFRGPGRYVGTALGIHVLDEGIWYGEGEVKIYRDGDLEYPTYAGTGTEDYPGAGYGLVRHYGPYGGAPLIVAPADGDQMNENMSNRKNMDFVGLYRWHLLDPVIFQRELKVTIQQLGMAVFKPGMEREFEAFKSSHFTAAGHPWGMNPDYRNLMAAAMVERSDDVCATAFVYCMQPQSVPWVNPALAAKDVGRLAYEKTDSDEAEYLRIWAQKQRHDAGASPASPE